MATNLYAIGEIFVASGNGFAKMLAQEGQMSFSRKTNSQAVLTTILGYAGESPGAPMCEVEITNAVPSAGFELDPGDFMGSTGDSSTTGLSVVTFTLFVANKVLAFKGFIIEDSFSHAVNSEAKLQFKARGEFALWRPYV
jgi:hypothetical protein